MAKKITNLKAYVLAKTDCAIDGCWVWHGGTNKRGYGKIKFGGKDYLAHRVSFALYKNIPIELVPDVLMHSCDNPPCINPAHLSEGTHMLNVHDMHRKGRAPAPIPQVGDANRNSVLTLLDVEKIIDMINGGVGNTEIGNIYGVHNSTISAIKRGKTWSNVPR